MTSVRTRTRSGEIPERVAPSHGPSDRGQLVGEANDVEAVVLAREPQLRLIPPAEPANVRRDPVGGALLTLPVEVIGAGNLSLDGRRFVVRDLAWASGILNIEHAQAGFEVAAG